MISLNYKRKIPELDTAIEKSEMVNQTDQARIGDAEARISELKYV